METRIEITKQKVKQEKKIKKTLKKSDVSYIKIVKQN